MKKKIGIFGGTFDPIHKGHLTALDNFIKRVQPQKTLLIPAGIPPHKKNSETPIEDRINMVRTAVRDFKNIEICLYEALKTVKCYSFDTLTYLHGVYPDAEFVMFVGSDMLQSFDSWYRASELAKLTSVAVFSRYNDDLNLLKAKIEELKSNIGLQAELYEDTSEVVSSTEIRRSFAEKNFPYNVLPETAAYVSAKGLYGVEKFFNKEAVLEALKIRLSPSRFAHVLGVAQTSVKYALIYGADPNKAEIAGFLHDCTKDFSYEENLSLIKTYEYKTSSDDRKEPIIHSVTAPLSAKYDFGIEDNEILDALRYHTTGRKSMTLLDKIIYVADFTEPTRNYSDVEFYRKKAESNIDEALFAGMKWIIKDKIDENKFLHPDSVKMFNAMLESR